jgi:outer membrane protein OmpA-like peptidoglycan-associated protein
MKRIAPALVAGTLLFAVAGCATKSQTGAAVGAGSGAVVGGLIGKAAGSTAAGAILGAAVGGAAGAIIGGYMDRQAEEIQRDIDGARVERIGEGIKITFASGILFDVDKADLQWEAQQNLTKLAGILNKYGDTNVLIEGHTDATGPDEHNLQLSNRRAQSVATHLGGVGVSSNRFSLMGYGEAQPIASNDTAEGRRQNRRVEVAIWANDKLKNEAAKQTRG